jgi:hypothetical protein
MIAKTKHQVDRSSLNFADVVKVTFSFLREYGLLEVEATPSLVRYKTTCVEVDIYHGRSSFELGFGITQEGVRYSLPEFMRLKDPELEQQYRYPTVTTQAALKKFLEKTADLVQTYCIRGLACDSTVFQQLSAQRIIWRKKFALEVMVYQIRPKAYEAFRQKKYGEAAELYKQIESSLTATEAKKLAIANERSSI